MIVNALIPLHVLLCHMETKTIGDCYVAVTGLPDPQADHAVIMARFARECVHRMHALVLGQARACDGHIPVQILP